MTHPPDDGGRPDSFRTFEEMREWMQRQYAELNAKADQLRSEMPPHRTPHPTQSYESLDHFLFQPDLHWNGRTVDRD